MIDPSVAETLIEVATSTSVEVVSRRTIDPRILAAGQAYRVFSIIEPATRIAQAFRVAAYADVASILAYELVVEVTAKKLSDAFGSLETVNFSVHRQAEGYLLEPDFAHPALVDTQILAPYSFDRQFGDGEFKQMGGALVQLGYNCIERGIRARSVVVELMRYRETTKERQYRNWNRRQNWLDKVNEVSGYVLWRPVPEIGLGSGRITNRSVYSGIYRRDKPEGYGRVTMDNGEVWFGQVRDHFPTNYGVTEYPDGRLFIGYIPEHAPYLGASISAKRDKIVFGGHDYSGIPEGWARQIGIANGVESRSGFWHSGELTHPVEFEADVLKRIAVEKFDNLPQLRAEYQLNAKSAGAIQIRNDDLIVSAVQEFL